MRFQCSHCQTILDIEDCEPGELVQCGQCESAVAAPLAATSPGALIGDFIIKRELGVGGMGVVYLAHQASLERDVAIKVLHANFAEDEAFIESFIREARAAAAVNHPNIVQAYAVNSENGLFYFAMEYIDGETLKQSLAERGRLPAEEVIDIAQDIVAALGFAWKERRIVHRDVKPDNIMIANTGHAKLADLGLARKITETNPDGSSELFGTPQYIAPELLFGYSPDARSDIYSLGCTLYHLVSGQYPFGGAAPEEVVNKHLFTPLTPLLEVAPDAPPGLAAMIELMMAKRPAQRYPDYDLIAADLKLVKAGRMPSHAAAPDAQHPIDGNSDNPFAIPEGSEAIISHANTATPSPKKKIVFSTTPKPPSATGSTPPSATGSTPPSATGSTPPSATGSTPP
ncbi:MAG: protein kinase, partial [Lentisphaerae bacterium]|nr:protein kinase [Lentisphaerota bacterium]